MPVFNTNITLEERRKAVLQLARISGVAYLPSDGVTRTEEEREAIIAAGIDAKLDIGDIEAKAWLQTTEPTDTLITVSNYITARNILHGIGRDENLRAAQDYMNNAKALVEAKNNKLPEQNETTIKATNANSTASTF